MRTFLLCAAVGLLSGWLAQTASAQPPAAPKAPAAAPSATAPTKPAPPAKPAAPAQAVASGPEEAVRKASKAYVAALNAGDFKTAATFWTADGEYVDKTGKSTPAQKMVSEDLPKKYPDGKRPQLALDVKSVQLLTGEIAQEVGSVQVKHKEGKPGPRGPFSALWVKQQNKWLLKSIRETAPAALTHTNSLADLSWLIGSWAAESDGNDIYIDCNWSPNKVYLLRTITVMRDGKLKHSISQRIGLDPLSPKIKSWSFDSDGGLAEAFWEKIDGTWHVASRGANPQGHITTARNVYDDIGPDSFTLESGEAHSGSTAMPAFKVKFTRDVAEETAGPPATGDKPATNNSPAAGNPPATGNTAATEKPTPTVPSSGGTDSMQKEQILGSPVWQQTQQAYNEWLSVQKIYSPAEVKKIKADTADKIAKMSAEQLANYLEDWREKVKILMSKDAEDARLWLAQRMAVEVKPTAAQLKESRPDIANMTAAQVEERLMQLDSERKQIQDAQKSFVADRKFRVKSIDDQQKEYDSEREQALNRAAEELGSGYGGYYGGYGGGVPGAIGGYGYGAGYGGGWGGFGGYRW